MTPKEISKIADSWWMQRAKRLAAEKKVAEMEKVEKALKDKLIASLEAAGISSIGGKKVKTELKPKTKYNVGDWDKFYQYIKKKNAFDLLQKRLSEAAVKLRVEDGVEIPGVYSVDVNDISYSEIKSS